MIKQIKYLCILILSLILMTSAVSAADYPEKLRVGIYYGASSLDSAGLSAEDGFYMGRYKDRDFIPVFPVFENEITVTPNTAASLGGTAGDGGAYHVLYYTCASETDIYGHLETLTANRIDAFAAYVNGQIQILSTPFKNNNDALWAAQNLAVTGTVYHSNNNSLRAVSKASGKTVFMFDSEDSAFGICNVNVENKAATVTVSGSASGAYRGGFEFKTTDEGIRAINVVPVEGYLYGVISREMSPSWHVEALKAQTVCARTYAYSRINHHSKYGFDVCSSVCCQAYSGTSREDENVRTAVDSTMSEIMMYDGKPIQAVYSSSMGSSTESVEYVWGSKIPYLVSVENPYEDTANVYNGVWTKTLTLDRATEIMASKGHKVGSVTSVEAIEYTPSGRVLKLRVVGTEGEKIFEREACRSIFSEATYSQKYTVSTGGTTTYPSISVTDGKTTSSKKLNALSAVSASGNVVRFSALLSATNGADIKNYNVIKTEGDANTLTFSGEGWGHGVGMSQYGAKGMAEAGFGYKDILTHYYTGITIEKAY